MVPDLLTLILSSSWIHESCHASKRAEDIIADMNLRQGSSIGSVVRLQDRTTSSRRKDTEVIHE